MNQQNQEDILEKYPYFKEYSNSMILLKKDEYDELMSGPKLKRGDKEVSVRLLKELLTTDFGFSYVKKCVDKTTYEVAVSYLIYGDTAGTIKVQRTDIVMFTDEAIKQGLLELTPLLQERLEYIRSKMSYEFFKSRCGEDYNIEVDGITYTIPSSLLFKILEMEDEELARICFDSSITYLGGIPKVPLIYATMKYFDNGCMDEYLFSPKLRKRLYDLKTNAFIDIQAINKHQEIDDINQSSIIVNEKLRRAIYANMPESLSKIEEAIYIYIMMCKILTYDEEFYALNQNVPSTDNHRQISYISEITPSNNQVVCYEFNAIYAKLLEELGIKFTIDYKDIMGQRYGVGHTSLEWRFHKFLVKADSSETFLGNDMMQAKLNQPLKGLNCINYNKETQEEFRNLVSRIYRKIALMENKEAKNIEQVETLDDLLKSYHNYTTNFREVSLDEKIDIFFNKMGRNKGLKGIDLLAYVLQLSKVIFTEDEQKNNVNVVIIRKNNLKEPTSVKPVAVLVVNTRSINEYSEENEYFIYDSEGHLSSIDIYDLQERFDEEMLAYIDPAKDIEISGISKGGKK